MKSAMARRAWLAVALVLLCAGRSYGQACKPGMTLLQIVNAAADVVKDGSPRSAIDVCYTLGRDSQAFDDGDPATEERFLFEYLDATVQAANAVTPENAKQFWTEGIDVANRYLDWYQDLSASDRTGLGRGHNRVSNVIFTLGDIYVRLGDGASFLEKYEEIAADHQDFFTPRCVDQWEKSLRSFPNFARLLAEDEISKQLTASQEYAEHWRTFVQFLQAFEGVKDMARYAREKIRTVAKFATA
ncbi:MAG TPA: hypothetical protein VL099_10700 [Candidatus Binatia bacterium]|nr:hypothetical protein [Candidatus Binatia bacterium]